MRPWTRESAPALARQDRLQRTEATFEPLPLDAAVARAYGRVYFDYRERLAVKLVDDAAFGLIIAATAASSNELPLYTRNPDDFDGLVDLVEVVTV